MNTLFCGSACVKYILKQFNICGTAINTQMLWITELALCLKLNGIHNLKILCYKSHLLKDYQNNRNIKFDGFYYINKCLKSGINIVEKKLNEKELIQEVSDNKYIILCIQSSIFNNDKNMEGGHFIILDGLCNGKIKIINPQKNQYETRIENIRNVVKYCRNYGSWRILIKEENE